MSVEWWYGTLLVLAWVAASFLYEVSITLEWEEVRLLTCSSGWVGHKYNPSVKIMLIRGLCRLMDKLANHTFLDHNSAERGEWIVGFPGVAH